MATAQMHFISAEIRSAAHPLKRALTEALPTLCELALFILEASSLRFANIEQLGVAADSGIKA
jgi:hypothetical protein